MKRAYRHSEGDGGIKFGMYAKRRKVKMSKKMSKDKISKIKMMRVQIEDAQKLNYQCP